MPIIRGAAEGDKVVAVLRSAAQDSRLSYRARGILLACMSRPVDWSTNAEALAHEAKEGEHAVLTALRELARFGYLHRERVRLPNGRITTTWSLTDLPNKRIPEPRFPRGGFPRGGSPRGGSPRGEKPRLLLEGDTKRETPPPTPAAMDRPDRGGELARVVVEELPEATPRPGGRTVLAEARRLAGQGWTVDQVRDLIRGHDWTGARAGAVVALLREQDTPPRGRQRPARRPPWCGRCHETTRLVTDPESGRTGRCPDCHPRSPRAQGPGSTEGDTP